MTYIPFAIMPFQCHHHYLYFLFTLPLLLPMRRHAAIIFLRCCYTFALFFSRRLRLIRMPAPCLRLARCAIYFRARSMICYDMLIRGAQRVYFFALMLPRYAMKDILRQCVCAIRCRAAYAMFFTPAQRDAVAATPLRERLASLWCYAMRLRGYDITMMRRERAMPYDVVAAFFLARCCARYA